MPPGTSSCSGGSEYVWQRGVEGISGRVREPFKNVYSLRDRCIVFKQEVSVSSCMTYEIRDKSDRNFNRFPLVVVAR